MAMNVKFLKGTLENYEALASKDGGTLYFITDTGAIYLGETLVADKTVLDQDQVNKLVADALKNFYTKAEIDGFLANYRTSADQDVIDNEIKASVKAISDDYLKRADKTELEGKITAHETAVNTKFEDYSTTAQMNAAIDADVKVVTDYIAEHEADWSAKTDISDLEGRMTAVEAVADAAQTAQEVSDAIDAKIQEQNLSQYTTEQEVKDIVDGVISAAADVETTITGLTELVDYIEKHGGDASAMATDIGTLKGKVEVIEKKPAYEITSTQVSNWDGEVGAKALAETKTTTAEVKNQIEAYQYATEADLTLAENRIKANEDKLAGIDTTVVAYVDAEIAKVDAAGIGEAIDKKADKVTGATAGNFAGLDANGNLTDSGSKAADFATAAQGAKADTAVQAADSTIVPGYTNFKTGDETVKFVHFEGTIKSQATSGSGSASLDSQGLTVNNGKTGSDRAYSVYSVGKIINKGQYQISLPEATGTLALVSEVEGAEQNAKDYADTKLQDYTKTADLGDLALLDNVKEIYNSDGYYQVTIGSDAEELKPSIVVKTNGGAGSASTYEFGNTGTLAVVSDVSTAESNAKTYADGLLAALRGAASADVTIEALVKAINKCIKGTEETTLQTASLTDNINNLDSRADAIEDVLTWGEIK